MPSIAERPPILEPQVSAELAAAEDERVVRILNNYWTEARTARSSGDHPRDSKWRENVDLYNNNFDFSMKADWQAKEVMPEVPQYVDRFAAAMKQSLMQDENYYSMSFPGDEGDQFASALKKLLDIILSKCGQAPLGQPIGFPAVFEDLMKLGALMQVGAAVKWKDNGKNGWVSVEPVDPRMVWLDATGRGLYRVYRMEVDRHELLRLKDLADGNGQPLFNLDAIDTVVAGYDAWEQAERQRLSGTASANQTSYRKKITLDEYLCTIVDEDGKTLGDNVLAVVAGEKTLIRGPEDNPYWHKQDWVLTSPIVTVPLSPYGRAYAENFGSLARSFNDLTNLLLDAVQTSAIKAFAANVDQLEDPTQLDRGIFPNVIFRLESGKAQDFMEAIQLGQIPADAVQMWQALKNELQEAAAFSELSLGQMAPKGRTSAQEISTVSQAGSAFMAALANTIEVRILEPLLNLVWMTFLQHMPRHDQALEAAIGAPMYAAIYQRRKEFVDSPVTFRVRGISSRLARNLQFKNLVQVLSIIGQSPPLAQKFLQTTNLDKLMSVMFKLNDIDPTEFEMTAQEKMIQSITAQGQPPGGQPGGPNEPPTGQPPGPAVAPPGGPNG